MNILLMLAVLVVGVDGQLPEEAYFDKDSQGLESVVVSAASKSKAFVDKKAIAIGKHEVTLVKPASSISKVLDSKATKRDSTQMSEDEDNDGVVSISFSDQTDQPVKELTTTAFAEPAALQPSNPVKQPELATAAFSDPTRLETTARDKSPLVKLEIPADVVEDHPVVANEIVGEKDCVLASYGEDVPLGGCCDSGCDGCCNGGTIGFEDHNVCFQSHPCRKFGLLHQFNPSPHHSPGNMPQHFPYVAAPKNYYYFRPYNWMHIMAHQQEVQLYGGDRRHPYKNDLFRDIYREVEADAHRLHFAE